MKYLFLVLAVIVSGCHKAKEEPKAVTTENKKVVAMNTGMNVKNGDDIPYNK